MQEHDLSYVRMEMINAREAPLRERGFVRWLRINLFATPLDTVLTCWACCSWPISCRRSSAGP
jgi:general L-amino acid transport system permease protein